MAWFNAVDANDYRCRWKCPLRSEYSFMESKHRLRQQFSTQLFRSTSLNSMGFAFLQPWIELCCCIPVQCACVHMGASLTEVVSQSSVNVFTEHLLYTWPQMQPTTVNIVWRCSSAVLSVPHDAGLSFSAFIWSSRQVPLLNSLGMLGQPDTTRHCGRYVLNVTDGWFLSLNL